MVMRTMVVYESMFGNTAAIAAAIAEGLGDGVELREVGTAPDPGPDLDLLVVGGPTHAFGLTREATRHSAAEQAPGGHLVSTGIGVREWLDRLPSAERATRIASFDTRVTPARVPGSAAKGIAKRLKVKGFVEATKPRTFWVTGTPGPLLDGEIDAARAWGRALSGS